MEKIMQKRIGSLVIMRKPVLVMALAVFMATAPALAITLGQPDENNHPNVGMMIVRLDDGTLHPFCSGTMVSERVFLTAGHCISDVDQLYAPVGYELGVVFLSDLGYDLGLDDPVLNFDESDLFMGVGYAHPSELAPKYGGSSSKRVDVGVIVLEDDPGVGQSDLPAVNLLDTIDLKTAAFTTVGYGLVRDDKTKGPQTITFDGVRRYAVQPATELSSQWLKLSMNLAKDDGGTCYGDSGGPHFLGAGAEETDTVVSVTGHGDSYCRSTDWTARVDTEAALSFILSFIDD